MVGWDIHGPKAGIVSASSGGVSNKEALSLSELKDIILDNSEMAAEQPQPPTGDGLLQRAKLCLHRLRASGLDDGPGTILQRGRAALAIARFIVDDPHSSDKDIALALTEFTWAVADADEALKRMREGNTDGSQTAVALLREAAELAVLTRVEYADFLCTMSGRETIESRRLRKHALLLCRVLKDADGRPLLEPDSLARRVAEESQGTTFYSTNAFSSVTLSSGESKNRPKSYSRPKRGHLPSVATDIASHVILPEMVRHHTGPKEQLTIGVAPRVKPRKIEDRNPFVHYEDLGQLRAQKRRWLYTDDDYVQSAESTRNLKAQQIRMRMRQYKDDIVQFHKQLEESDPNALYEQVVKFSPFGMKARSRSDARRRKAYSTAETSGVPLPRLESSSKKNAAAGRRAVGAGDYEIARKLSMIGKAKDLGSLARIIEQSTTLVEEAETAAVVSDIPTQSKPILPGLLGLSLGFKRA
ncbi:hypothetical protein FOL47_008791 [Perkinsus chesapeaki]|uniref:Uncharacterized protein n=1 Tax=Perkinsus chesapeaki TaxID=330153 RepID=A0A7J6MV11_PERCH|nr:hypothetical protein FOL47_008791 [Perkinsus chesapeaki]